jgi:hypothetical protein
MDTQLFNLKRKVNQYKETLEHTKAYREAWKNGLKDRIIKILEHLNTKSELGAKIEVREEMENLNAVVLTLGDSKSGMYTEVGEEIQRHLIKHNGSLVYQQLFNGKIIVLINYPFIENYGRPHPPKSVAIYRPEELTDPFFIRHLEEFVTEITKWEDYDDDEPMKRIGFDMNFGPAPAPMDKAPKED